MSVSCKHFTVHLFRMFNLQVRYSVNTACSLLTIFNSNNTYITQVIGILSEICVVPYESIQELID